MDAAYDEPYGSGPAPQTWDDYGAESGWEAGGTRAPASGGGSRLRNRQLRAPRLPLGGATRQRGTRSFGTQAPSIHIPNLFGRVELLRDQVAVALLGLAVLSAVLMAGVLAGRIGNLPDVIALRYDAAGTATRWGTSEALWELPLLAGMVSIINIVLAWWLSPIDRFASRFMLATAVLVSVLAWVSLVRFLW